jgi:hypothetical protein
MPLGNQPPRHMKELAGKVRVDEEVLAHSGSGKKFMAIRQT